MRRLRKIGAFAFLFVWAASLIFFPVSQFIQIEIATACSEKSVSSHDYFMALLPVITSIALVIFLVQMSSQLPPGFLFLPAGIKIGLLGPVSMFALFQPMFGYMQNGVLLGNQVLDEKSDYIYYTAVTLTTLGYGDMLPCPSSRPFVTAHAAVGILVVPLLVGWAFAAATKKTR